MTYYIISEDDGTLLETSERMSDEIIANYAAVFECNVYAIRGEHSGFSARKPTPVTPRKTRFDAESLSGILPLGKAGCEKCEDWTYYCKECTSKMLATLTPADIGKVAIVIGEKLR